jgi:predicted short-subunit dehydrogenase-like oxidoreductase (DUF2520 family)
MHNIVCIGAGKLANQLMPALEREGYDILQVYSRTAANAKSLATHLHNTTFTTDILKIQPGADLYFFAIKDDAIEMVAHEARYLDNDQSVFVHSSGILPMNALPFSRRGIFYPLQTFSANHTVDWKNTPLLITAATEEITAALTTLAEKISNLVYQVGDDDRAVLHVAAVFANNFTNHMLTLAESICQEHHISFEILKPIIRETVVKALDVGPANSQTGPAIRGDQHTIEKHLRLLADDPKLQELYMKITESIMKHSR